MATVLNSEFWQVDLKLKVCKGSPIHKFILREAKSCGATSLILGTSGVDHKIRSRTSVAKYCTKNLQKNVSVICVNNGKIVFGRESNTSGVSLLGSVDVTRPRSRRRKLSKSPLSLPPQRLLTSSSDESQNVSMALVPIKTRDSSEPKSGWAVLRKSLFHGIRLPESPSSKKSFVMRWILRLPNRQSDAAIYPDQKQTSTSDTSEGLTDLDPEKGAIVVYSVDNDSNLYSAKIFSEGLNALTEKYSSTCQLFSYQELVLATNNFIPGSFFYWFANFLVQSFFSCVIIDVCYLFRKFNRKGWMQPGLSRLSTRRPGISCEDTKTIRRCTETICFRN